MGVFCVVLFTIFFPFFYLGSVWMEINRNRFSRFFDDVSLTFCVIRRGAIFVGNFCEFVKLFSLKIFECRALFDIFADRFIGLKNLIERAFDISWCSAKTQHFLCDFMGIYLDVFNALPCKIDKQWAVLFFCFFHLF